MFWVDRQKRHHRLLLRATTDTLTGALNRAAFNDHLSTALRRYTEVGKGCALIFIDLDDLKTVNDIHGHEAGDACLRETVACARAYIRDSDTVGRLGGDEFAVILAPCKNRDAAAAVVGKIRHRLDALPAPYAGATEPVRASFGLAACPDDGTQAEMLLRIADQAMYGAKRNRQTQARTDDPAASPP